jgi:hypothetical protein
MNYFTALSNKLDEAYTLKPGETYHVESATNAVIAHLAKAQKTYNQLTHTELTTIIQRHISNS